MLVVGYLNELLRSIKYVLHLKCCKLSEETLIMCLKVLTKTLTSCASGGGRKGQASRLDATLSLLALLRQIYSENIPIQVCKYFVYLFNIKSMSIINKYVNLLLH